MSDKYFEVFKEPGDHERWDKHIEYVLSLNTISEAVKDEWIRAAEFLQQEFGRTFLQLRKDGEIHPLHAKISNKAPWQIHEVISFAKTLRTIKESSCSNHTKIKSKLESPNKFVFEGFPFLQIAESFLNEGMEILFLEESKNSKSPDIEVRNAINSDNFFVEVSILNAGEARDLYETSYYLLRRAFQLGSFGFPVTAKQKDVFSEESLDRLVEVIARTKKQVININHPVSYSDEIVEFTLFPNDQHDEMVKYADSLGRRPNDIEGLALKSDEVDRLIGGGKIKDKARQIPNSTNGIIYIPVDSLFFYSNLLWALDRLGEYLLRFPNLIGVVLFSHALDPGADEFIDIEYKGHHYYNKTFNNVLSRKSLFICNHKCNMVIAPETLNQIHNSFK